MESSIAEMLPLTHLTYHILLVLREEPLHGYAISKEVAELSRGRITPGTGTFYSALHRMLDDGLVEEVDQPDEIEGSDSRRRFYALTRFGGQVLAAERSRLTELLEVGGATYRPAG